MEPARSPDDLAGDPVGRYWLGPTQLVWCRDARTCGSIHWGRPTLDDMRDLTRALELATHPALAAGFEVFMDSRDIEHVAWAPFSQLFDYVRDRIEAWSSRIQRHAVVMPAGAKGALLAGVLPLLGMPYPAQFFSDTDAALAWLGWPADAVEEAVRLVGAASREDAVVRALQAWLDAHLDNATIDNAAGALGVANRSLQRELAAAQTSFTDELHAARVRVAKELLSGTEDKIESIARSVGYASASRLAELFRRATNESPAQYRARLRVEAAATQRAAAERRR